MSKEDGWTIAAAFDVVEVWRTGEVSSTFYSSGRLDKHDFEITPNGSLLVRTYNGGDVVQVTAFHPGSWIFVRAYDEPFDGESGDADLINGDRLGAE